MGLPYPNVLILGWFLPTEILFGASLEKFAAITPRYLLLPPALHYQPIETGIIQKIRGSQHNN